ncbi:MAG: glycosyltransferase family 9 protein [Phycisphaerales bacterium]|nr:glycosyltransferase family 9 protein [Phycisphaerales bacterium]
MQRIDVEGVREAWVLHRGALGDSVLTWPVLRHLVKSGVATTFVADLAKAELASACVGVRAVDAESQAMLALWRQGGTVEGQPNAGLVLDYEHGASQARDAKVKRMFPRARVMPMAQARGGDALRAFVEAHPLARAEAGGAEDGAIVLHVGAGSDAKRWAMANWCELHERLCEDGAGVVAIAGEVERERFTRTDAGFFQRMSGRWIDTLAELREVVSGARAFIGNDSGPMHLAAQMGVATLAVFGATDAREWGPVGPRVRVVGSAKRWPGVDEVAKAAGGLMG